MAITMLSISEFLPDFVVPPYGLSHPGREPDDGALLTPPDFAVFTRSGPSYSRRIAHLPSGVR